jgi:hypothetical protein
MRYYKREHLPHFGDIAGSTSSQEFFDYYGAVFL